GASSERGANSRQTRPRLRSGIARANDIVKAMAVTRARPELGVVYTPRDVCEPMVRGALDPLVSGRDRRGILSLRVCDPAIGEGAFLIEIVRVLAEALPGVRDAR